MDFGALGFEDTNETRRKVSGSGVVFGKKDSSSSGEDDWKSSKIGVNGDLYAPKTMPLSRESPWLRSNSMVVEEGGQQEHMLSFSSVKSEGPFLDKTGAIGDWNMQNNAFLSYQHPPFAHTINAGYGSVILNTSMQGSFDEVRGVFTPSQWIELEHQALIYKYIIANVPVPSNLIGPLKKSLSLCAMSASSAGSYIHTSFGWDSFPIGLSGKTDPEPGRCRRTDGKKWRCAKNAVADQKYCDRHINRGRHRSRKPVEGQTGHVSSGTTSSKSNFVISSGGTSTSVVIPQHKSKSMQTDVTDPSTEMLVNRIHDAQSLMMMYGTINVKSKESPMLISKQNKLIRGSEFGIVSSDSLLNPSLNSSYPACKSHVSFQDFNNREIEDPYSIITWPKDLRSDWTQLSMSIPLTSNDFSSSQFSPTQEKLALSPSSLARDFDPIQVGLLTSTNHTEPTQKQTNWIPYSWETSLGGPLGEVVAHSSSNDKWDVKLHSGSSPTGVLQNGRFSSLSNSSLESSPIFDNKNQNGSSIFDDVLESRI